MPDKVPAILKDAWRQLGRLFALSNDDPRKIVTVAVTLCLVCSLIVSGAAVGLRPLQERNESLALKREIVKVAGLYGPDVDIEQAFADLEVQLVELASGEYVDGVDAVAFDLRAAAADPKQSTALRNEQDPARIRSRADRMPVYLLHEQGQLRRLILPVYGYGLWSTMYGLLALAPDGRTVEEVSFYDQRETAGLGGEVANPRWLASWVGKQVVDEQGVPVFEVVKGNVDTNDPAAGYQIDGLAGATLTSNGVTHLVRFWLGELGYGPFLARIRAAQD